jgi:cyclase
MDSVASLYGRNSLADIVERTAEQIFVPLTVGGGLRSVDDIRAILRAGADKVAVNTAAILNPRLIAEAADAFGSQCVVLSVEARRLPSGAYECMTDNAREKSGREVDAWVAEAVRLGAGEILLTSVDQEGTGKGFDIELTRRIACAVDVPVIACGGAGSADDVRRVIIEGRADAVCLGSILHYHDLASMQQAEYAEEGNVEFLRNKIPAASTVGLTRRGIEPVALSALKRTLREQGIPCR